MNTWLQNPSNQWRLRIFAVTWLAYAGFYLCRKNLSVLMPVLQGDLGISKLDLANIVFAYSLAYALGQFVTGILADRFGARTVVTAGLLLSVASNLAMGWSPTVLMLFVLGMLNGMGQSAGWPGLVKNMATWFRPEERGVVMAWWTTNYVLGGFIATLVATFVISNPMPLPGVSWQHGFWIPSLLLLGVTIVFAYFARNRPEDAGLPPIVAEEMPASPASVDKSRGVMLQVLARPAVWITGVSAFLLKVIRYSFLFWLPLYMTDHLGYTAERAGYASSIFELVGFLGALVAGYASDKLFGARRFPVTSIMMAGLAVVCLLHPFIADRGLLWNLLGIALIGIMTYGPDTLMQGAASQDAGAGGGEASAAGVICGIASLGQLASPYFVALAADRFGWDALFYVFVAIALAGSVLTAIFWNFRPALSQSQRDLPS
ncbi:MAG: MFS transporter [Bryobacterales bacterium]|nr:MFS transporter [Bryobacterales bacterium]